MSSAKIMWINSVSPDVVKTIIYRDDKKIGEVLVTEPSEFTDNNVVQGETYKYEVQAATEDVITQREVVDVNVKDQLIPQVEGVVLRTVSTSSTWTPSVVINTGEILIWEVSGGVTIPPIQSNNPILDLSENIGVAVITIKSTTAFAGLTEFRVDNLLIESIDVSLMMDLLTFSCKGDNTLISATVIGLLELSNLTVRTQALTLIDTSENIGLELLYAYDNELTNIDITNNPLLSLVHLDNNKLTADAQDKLINDLAAGSINDGTLNLLNQPESLTYASYDGYYTLINRGWSINIPSAKPLIPTDITASYIENIKIPTNINLTQL